MQSRAIVIGITALHAVIGVVKPGGNNGFDLPSDYIIYILV